MAAMTQAEQVKQLLKLLEDDIKTKDLGQQQLEETVGELKILGRDVNNARILFDGDGIQTLGSYAFGNHSSKITREVLGCLANLLLLLPVSRQRFVDYGFDIKVAESLHTTTEDNDEFLLCRILFLLTYGTTTDFAALIENSNLAQSIVAHLDRHAKQTSNEMAWDPTSMGVMAASESLKLLFNVTNANPSWMNQFGPAVQPLFALLRNCPITKPPLQPPLTYILNASANLELDGSKGKDRVSEDSEKPQFECEKLIAILENVVQAYPAAQLDTAAIPLLTVIRKIINVADEITKTYLRQHLLPKDEERDLPLGKSTSLASRLLRFTTAGGLNNLPDTVSSLLFELSDKDASQFVTNIGYGYAAGYLMTHKIPIPENARQAQGAKLEGTGIPINPITGQRLDKEDPDTLPEMTQEEKEREAERLFVLFEKLKRTGVVDVKNPVQQAMEEGRFEELSDSE